MAVTPHRPNENNSPVASITSAARRLGISENTVRKWADRGTLPCLKTEWGSRFILREDLERVARERGR